MSAGHSEASFNHSCLKVPVSKYDRESSGECSRKGKPPDKTDVYMPSYDSFQFVKSYLKFYESIPDYTELHHLSNEEFYSQLESLKITQKRFCTESGVLNRDKDLMPDIRKFERNGNVECQEKKGDLYCSVCCLDNDYCKSVNGEKVESECNIKQNCCPPKINVVSDNDVASDMSEVKKNSDYEADRESSTLQIPEKNHGRRFMSSQNGRETYLGRDCEKGSWVTGSGCECDTPESCHRYLDSSFGLRTNQWRRRLNSGCCLSAKEKTSGKKGSEISSRSIPLTSRIPLFDKIMEEKEARRKIIHERYSQKLRSLVQPFSFTKKEEESNRLRMVRSNPELRSANVPTVRFKAKPIPKNLFSDYAYERMREEEFYRALKRRVRAEEMLKASSLPPSMALRERKYLSKSLDVIDYDDDEKFPQKSWENGYAYDSVCRDIRRDIETDEKRKSERKKNGLGWLLNKSRRQTSATDSSTEASPYQSVLSDVRRNTRPHSAYFSNHRNNLASVLRIETARKRLEKEMEDKLRESRLKQEARFKARITRMAPDWKALQYDKDEDLALRLAVKRKENRQRQEKHEKLMESMYGRVYSMPPMFNSERFGKTVKKKKNTVKCVSSYVKNESRQEPEIDSRSLPKQYETKNGSFDTYNFFRRSERRECQSKDAGSDDASRRENQENELLEDRKPFTTSFLR